MAASSSRGCRIEDYDNRVEHYARAFDPRNFVSSCRGGLDPDSPPFWYIWQGLPFASLLPPPIQLHGSCSFAAVARQVEYDIRIRHAKENQPYNVGFNHRGWETLVRNKDPNRLNWDPFTLMKMILNETVPNKPDDDNEPRLGLLVSGSTMSHYCNIIYKEEGPSAELITRWLKIYRVPLVAIVPVMSTYPSHSQWPYTNPTNISMSQLHSEKRQHAIILVGVYEPSKDNNPLKLDLSRTFYIFQSPFPEEIVDALAAKKIWSLLPCGMSVIDSTLIMHICGTSNFPQQAIIHRSVRQARLRNWTEAQELSSMIKHYEAMAIRQSAGRQAIRGMRID